MNTIKLMGGLGNQLFQYAFGQAMLANGIGVSYDVSWYYTTKHPDRPYGLDKYNISPILVDSMLPEQLYLKEINHEYKEVYPTLDGHYFDGYWQHLAYFKNIIPQLQKDLVTNKNITDTFLAQLEEIENDPLSISLHVRRGDYLVQRGWGVLPLRYYYLALKQAKGNLYVFSDDIEYCKPLFDEGYFSNRKVKFIKSRNIHSDFELMKSCKQHIIANSTFSYWAAILDPKLNKRVYCPEYWLGEVKPDEGDHYPLDWQRIKM